MSDGSSKTTLTRAEQIEDLDRLLDAIESLHPDPYVGYDNRVELFARAERIANSLPEAATVERLYRTLSPLLAGLDDAHSTIEPPKIGQPGDDASSADDDTVAADTADGDGTEPQSRRLPLSFRVVGDTLVVESVGRERHEDLLGRRLESVEGVAVAELAERAATLRGAENSVWARHTAGSTIGDYDPLARLLDRSEPPAEPTLRFGTGADTTTRAFSPVSKDSDSVASLDTTVPVPDGAGPRSQFYDDDSLALFVPGDLSGYRESFEAALATGAQRVAELAPAAYERHVGGDPPEDTADIVAELPSMVETIEDLTTRMAAAETETLVVDLRDNPGGDSQFLFHLAYALGGWATVRDAIESVSAVKRRTEQHRERYGQFETDGEPVLAHQYDFTDYDGTERSYGSDSESEDEGELSESVRERLHRSETFAEFTARTDGGVYEPPEVVVVTSARTMSSAFAATAQLRSLGATLVGVPSGQAPRSFGEAVEVTLPNSGLTANVAGAMYDWLPNPTSDTLRPDRELDEEAFDRFDHAADAGLRLAFNVAGVEEF